AAAHDVPLELTLSCMNPAIRDGVPRHCGLCSKCRERHDAFLVAGVADPTEHADTRFGRGSLLDTTRTRARPRPRPVFAARLAVASGGTKPGNHEQGR